MTKKRSRSRFRRREPTEPTEKFKKLDRDLIARLGVTKKPTLDYSWRRGAEFASIPSLNTPASGSLSVHSVMDPVSLQKESPATRDAIIAKSKRIAIAYNKGAYQYVTDDTDPKSLGSRSRR